MLRMHLKAQWERVLELVTADFWTQESQAVHTGGGARQRILKIRSTRVPPTGFSPRRPEDEGIQSNQLSYSAAVNPSRCLLRCCWLGLGWLHSSHRTSAPRDIAGPFSQLQSSQLATRRAKRLHETDQCQILRPPACLALRFSERQSRSQNDLIGKLCSSSPSQSSLQHSGQGGLRWTPLHTVAPSPGTVNGQPRRRPGLTNHTPDVPWGTLVCPGRQHTAQNLQMPVRGGRSKPDGVPSLAWRPLVICSPGTKAEGTSKLQGSR
ncbi:hypothetical protein B0J14DRAFT_557423 [Halenospora varia]|nr:hypothetical protein B0J14DRAFT_557423 [Halenospora varia]